MDNPNSNFKSISEIQNPNLKLERKNRFQRNDDLKKLTITNLINNKLLIVH
jgi:hypothetical protein